MLIASRALMLRDADAETEIPIRIFAPEQKDDSWICRYEIDWPEGRQVMASGGVDSVQSLVIALQMIGADIYSSSYHKSGKLVLAAPGKGYGFPVVSSLRDYSKATTKRTSDRYSKEHLRNRNKTCTFASGPHRRPAPQAVAKAEWIPRGGDAAGALELRLRACM